MDSEKNTEILFLWNVVPWERLQTPQRGSTFMEEINVSRNKQKIFFTHIYITVRPIIDTTLSICDPEGDKSASDSGRFTPV